VGAQALDHAELARDVRARLARDRLRPELGQPSRAELGEARIDVRRDREAQDAVPQEREPLVRLGPLVDPRRVREGLVREFVGQLIEEGSEGVGLRAQDGAQGACAAT
jgi:hypothetical protein